MKRKKEPKEDRPEISISLSAYKNSILLQVRIKNRYILREVNANESERIVKFFKNIFDMHKEKEGKTIEFEL